MSNYPPQIAALLITLATQAQADVNNILGGADTAAGSPNFKCRAVVTALSGSYTGSGTGTLTASAAAAFGTQDGISTLAAGDNVFLPAGLTNVTAAKDAGPYILSVLGTGSIAWILTRPQWWPTGATIQEGQSIVIGGEGSVFKGAEFRAMCGKSQVVDTNDAKLYPKNYRKTITLSSGTYTIGAGGGNELLFLYDTTLSSVQLTENTGSGTLGTNRLGAPAASRVAGAIGTAAIVVNSYVDAGTVATSDNSTVDVLVTNY